MKLKAKVAKLEDVPEKFRELYEAAEDGDGFVLIPEGVDDITAPALKNALKAERDRSEARLAAKIKEQFGLEPEELRAFMAKIKTDEKARERQELEAKGNYEKLLESHKVESAKEVEKQTKLNQALFGELQEALVTGTATRAIAGRKGKLKALLPAVLGKLKMIEDPDTHKHVVRVLDDRGEPRTSKGGWMSPDEYLDELKQDEEFSALFESDVQGGGGAGARKAPAGSGKKTMTRAAFDEMPAAERQKAALEPGFALTD